MGRELNDTSSSFLAKEAKVVHVQHSNVQSYASTKYQFVSECLSVRMLPVGIGWPQTPLSKKSHHSVKKSHHSAKKATTQ
jgi:hypothetical protein